MQFDVFVAIKLFKLPILMSQQRVLNIIAGNSFPIINLLYKKHGVIGGYVTFTSDDAASGTPICFRAGTRPASRSPSPRRGDATGTRGRRRTHPNSNVAAPRSSTSTGVRGPELGGRRDGRFRVESPGRRAESA